MSKNYRPSKQEYFWNIAREVAQRTTCMSVKGGAVIVHNDQIISTGYIGAPRGTKDCFERGNCIRRELKIPSGQRYELCRSVHAEQNAIINAARSGTSLINAKIYLYFAKRKGDEDVLVKAYPCFMCKKMIVNSGIDSFIGNDENGKIISYKISDWVKDWQEKDLIDDEIKYNSKY